MCIAVGIGRVCLCAFIVLLAPRLIPHRVSPLQMRYVDIDPITCRVNAKDMARRIDGNTIAIVGSCPQVRLLGLICRGSAGTAF